LAVPLVWYTCRPSKIAAAVNNTQRNAPKAMLASMAPQKLSPPQLTGPPTKTARAMNPANQNRAVTTPTAKYTSLCAHGASPCPLYAIRGAIMRKIRTRIDQIEQKRRKLTCDGESPEKNLLTT